VLEPCDEIFYELKFIHNKWRESRRFRRNIQAATIITPVPVGSGTLEMPATGAPKASP
jgi:hypothetical protein